MGKSLNTSMSWFNPRVELPSMGWAFVCLWVSCSSQTASAPDAGAAQDARAPDLWSEAASTAGDAADGPSCAYQNYTAVEYSGFADGGTLANLPCGGCAPASGVCSPEGLASGDRYNCWAAPLYDLPPAPGSGCRAIGVSIRGDEPTRWEVCCF